MRVIPHGGIITGTGTIGSHGNVAKRLSHAEKIKTNRQVKKQTAHQRNMNIDNNNETEAQ
jgi:hypothetical protein